MAASTNRKYGENGNHGTDLFSFLLLVRTLIFQFCGKLYILKSLKLVSLSDEYIDSPKHQRRITKAATKMASLSLKNIAVD